MLIIFCCLLFCVTCVDGTVDLPIPHPGINGIVPFAIRPVPDVDMTGSQFNLELPFGAMGAQGDGAWIQNGGGQRMYFNEMGMNNLYQDYWANQGGAFSSGQFYPGYQQNYQFTQQYEGGFQGSYMRPAMSFYPMPGMYKMDRRNCFFNGGFPSTIQSPVFPQQAPMFPQVNPTFPQPTPVLPRKTVQPVQPQQHLKVETLPPTQVQPKNSAGGFPIEIPKAKTPWEGTHIQTRLL